jgi:hypothetical protein
VSADPNSATNDAKSATPIAVAIAVVGAVLAAWTLLHLMKAGSCSSSSLYLAQHPCKKGTGLWIFGFIGGALVAAVGLICGLAVARLRLVAGCLFAILAAILVVDELSSHSLGGPPSNAAYTVAVLIGVPGLVLLAWELHAQRARPS